MVRAANPAILKWCHAVQSARKMLGIVGFVPVKKGTALYKLTKQIYEGEIKPIGPKCKSKAKPKPKAKKRVSRFSFF